VFDSRQGHDLLFPIMFRPALRPTQPSIQWVLEAPFLVVKRQGREANHSPPSSTEVKNGGAINSLPPYVFVEWCLINYTQGQIFTVTYTYTRIAFLKPFRFHQ
jgi:hypothetical protein